MCSHTKGTFKLYNKIRSGGLSEKALAPILFEIPGQHLENNSKYKLYKTIQMVLFGVGVFLYVFLYTKWGPQRVLGPVVLLNCPLTYPQTLSHTHAYYIHTHTHTTKMAIRLVDMYCTELDE